MRDDRRVGAVRWTVEIVRIFIALLTLAVLVTVARTLGKGLAIYLGALLAAWFLFAFVLPMVTGVIGPSDVLDNIRARRRTATHYEGEPLPSA